MPVAVNTAPRFNAEPRFEDKVLDAAASSPAVALMRVSIEIDRQLRLILAATGHLRGREGATLTETLDVIEKSAGMSEGLTSLRDSLQMFQAIRNQLIHGAASDDVALRAIDYGLRLVRAIKAIPRPAYVVRQIVELFSDAACQHRREDVNGIVLESFGLKGESFGSHVYPSSRSYKTGESVSWEWGIGGRQWNATWYQDPATGEAKSAWGESLEFLGRPLDQI